MIHAYFVIALELITQTVISESDCSVKCGWGKKTITTVQTSNTNMKPVPNLIIEDCDSGVECDPSYEWSKWGEWSKCPTCIKSIAQKPMTYRNRDCKPSGCISGRREERQCTDLHFCPPECPIFDITSVKNDNTHKTQMMVNFTMNKAEVYYGKWIDQEIKLRILMDLKIPVQLCPRKRSLKSRALQNFVNKMLNTQLCH